MRFFLYELLNKTCLESHQVKESKEFSNGFKICDETISYEFLLQRGSVKQ